MRKFGMNDEAFTGLEAAIVLIAFVVVAAVFSYVMLGAGFFTSQKSQEVVHTSVAQASSSMDVAGVVTGVGGADTTGTLLDTVTFFLKPTAGGSPSDISKVAYAVTTKDSVVIISHAEMTDTSSSPATVGTLGTISWAKTIDGTADNLLEKGEIVQVTINLKTAGVIVKPNDAFTIDVKPSVGAALPIVKHAPPGITDDKNYELN